MLGNPATDHVSDLISQLGIDFVSSKLFSVTSWQLMPRSANLARLLLEMCGLEGKLLDDVAIDVHKGQEFGLAKVLAGDKRVGEGLLPEVQPGRGRIRGRRHGRDQGGLLAE